MLAQPVKVNEMAMAVKQEVSFIDFDRVEVERRTRNYLQQNSIRLATSARLQSRRLLSAEFYRRQALEINSIVTNVTKSMNLIISDLILSRINLTNQPSHVTAMVV